MKKGLGIRDWGLGIGGRRLEIGGLGLALTRTLRLGNLLIPNPQSLIPQGSTL